MTQHPSLADFPVRPLRIDGESLGSWCWRIFLANGHEASFEARSASKMIRSIPPVNSNDSLVHLFGQERLKELRAQEGDLLERWPTRLQPTWYKWAATLRICPECVRVNGCHFAHWDLPLVTACALHGCQLTEQCSGCGRRLTWNSLKSDWTCSCGFFVLEPSPPPASSLEKNLAVMLFSASDAHLPPSLKSVPISALAIRTVYRVRDIYEMLWWLRRMRRALSDWRTYPVPRSWPDITRNDVRLKPDAREIRLLAGEGAVIGIKTRYALKHFFRKQPGTFVDLAELIEQKNLQELLRELHGKRNPLSLIVSEAIYQTVAKCSAGILDRPTVLFHPRLNANQRVSRIQSISHWWQRFSARVPRLSPVARLSSEVGGPDSDETTDATDPATALQLLNIFSVFAMTNAPLARLDAIATRWHIPVELQQSDDPFADLSSYLFNLHEAEVSFVLALATAALE